jgi:hypothetical protein
MTQGNNNHPTPGQPVSGGVVLRKGPRHLWPVVRTQPISRQAQCVAATILEVLAGVRTPTEAAATLGMGVPRYYLWEQRALAALVAGCEPRPAGQAISQRHQLAVLQREVARLKQECARQQALVRATQRTIGLVPPVAKPTERAGEKGTGKAAGKRGGKKSRQRRPAVRALKAVATLRATPVVDEPALAPSAGTAMTEVVQRSAEDHSPPAAVSAEVAPVAAGT